jgi:hypothetical protein
MKYISSTTQKIIYLMGAMWLFFGLFLSSQCDVGLNNDDICMNTSPLFCFLVEKPLVGNKILFTK